MSDFNVCLVCLSDNIKVYSIANTPLQEIYENLTSSKLLIQDGWPITVCYICVSHLQKCLKLVDLARNSQKLLIQLYHSGIPLSQDTVSILDRKACSFSVTPTESISLLDVFNQTKPNSITKYEKEAVSIIKNEKEESVARVIEDNNGEIRKGEPDEEIDVDYNNDNLMSSDSEDNVPLTALKLLNRRIKHDIIEHEKRGYQKDVKIDATEVYLTKEQQTQEVFARSKSYNYLNSPFKCHLCYKGFVSEAAFSNHTQKHDESSGVHKCEVCALRYHSARLLRTHTTTSHKRCFKCNKCEYIAHTTNQARDHDKWHDGFTFQCQLCGQKFRKRTSHLTHMRKNHPTECICELCGYSFVSKNGLQLHKNKTHRRDLEVTHGHEEMPTVPAEQRFCSVCGIQFARLKAYHRHLLSSFRHAHSSNNSTQCIICQQNHPDHGSLAEHMKIHKKMLLYGTPVHPKIPPTQLPCDVCGVSFSSRYRLTVHVRSTHLPVKPAKPASKQVVCELCGRQFKSATTLLYHLRRHRGERPFPCARCGKRFTNNHQLRIHSRTHSGERPYACRTCARTFTQKPALNRHYRVHTGAKPYACQVCSKCFSQSNSLKIHIQSVHLKMPLQRKQKASAPKNDCQIEINTES